MGDELEREGAPNRSQEKSAETDRSTGTRKQRHRRGTGGGNGGQQGDNGRGQANRPRPHVSTKETRKLRKNRGGQSTQGSIRAQDEGERDPKTGEGRREEGEGESRQKRSAATVGHSIVDERGIRVAMKHRERKARRKRKRGRRGRRDARWRRRGN